MLRQFMNVCSKMRGAVSSARYPVMMCTSATHTESAHITGDQQTQFQPVLHAGEEPLFYTGKAPKQAWLETLKVIDNEKQGIVNLHPDIFAVFPRVDILWENVYWQQFYGKINYDKAKNRAEVRGSNRKPWPQKGTGRARHGTTKSPLWINGGKAHGPRGPKSYFYMLPVSKRVLGLRTALSCKYAQDRLHIVDSLDLPTDDPKYLEELIEERGWGLSVLFINNTDVIPHNFAVASDENKPYNVMPAYGLNVYSMLKHETLVLTHDALNTIEGKLLQFMHTPDFKENKFSRQTWHRHVDW